MRKNIVLLIIITLPIPGLINIASRLLFASYSEPTRDALDIPTFADARDDVTRHSTPDSSHRQTVRRAPASTADNEHLVGLVSGPAGLESLDPDDERALTDDDGGLPQVVEGEAASRGGHRVSSVLETIKQRYKDAAAQDHGTTGVNTESQQQQQQQKKTTYDPWKSANKCPDLKSHPDYQNLQAPERESWQTVTPKRSYVYSAITDPRKKGKTLVNVFGIIEFEYQAYLESQGRGVYCQFWLPGDSGDVYAFQASIFRLSRDVETYASGTFTCILPFNHTKLPTSTRVSISESPCDFPSNLLRLHVNVDTGEFETEFMLCLCGPLKNGYKNTNEFVTWKEAHMMFGAERYALYNHSASVLIRRYAQADYDHGHVDVHRWNVPEELGDVSNYSVIWNLGQIVLVNDCLYRYMYKTRYLVFDDLDEIMVPRCQNCTTWHDMMAIVEADCPGKYHFSMRNVFFPTQKSSDMYYISKHESAYHLKITPLLKVLRQTAFMEHNDRSKFIYNPRGVKWTNIHNIFSAWNGTRQDVLCVVDPEVGGLHQYRQFWKEKTSVYDKTMQRFGDHLIDLYVEATQEIQEHLTHPGHLIPSD